MVHSSEFQAASRLGVRRSTACGALRLEDGPREAKPARRRYGELEKSIGPSLHRCPDRRLLLDQSNPQTFNWDDDAPPRI